MKKKPTKKPAESWRVIDVPVWEAQVFIYCGPFEGFTHRLREAGVEDVDDIARHGPLGGAVARTYSHGDGCQIIYSSEPMQTSALVHELLHATFGILESRRCKDEEAHAYLMTYLYKEATK